MALLPAYAVDGGRVPAEMARRATYALSSGANGIVAVNDLKVTQLPTPGAGVQVARGGALARMQTAGANAYETYVIAQDAASNVSITATGGSARTDYLIARVDDWHFTGGSAPADPLNALYWEFAIVGSLSGISQPYVALAQIDVPANTSTITDAMITDLRNVAIPRKERTVYPYNLNSGQTDLLDVANEPWPNLGGIDIDVPEWAVWANVTVTWAQAKVPAGSTLKGHLFGRFVVNGVTKDTGTVLYDADSPVNSTRQTFVLGARPLIPAGMRGYSGYFQPRATILSGSGAIQLDGNSAIIVDIEFIERRD